MRNLVLFLMLGLFTPTISFSVVPKNDLIINRFHKSVQVDLFSYPAETFQSRTRRILTPTILIEGGVFSYRRVSTGRGGLAINLRDGRIDLAISDSGTYEITYSVNGISQTLAITLS